MQLECDNIRLISIHRGPPPGCPTPTPRPIPSTPTSEERFPGDDLKTAASDQLESLEQWINSLRDFYETVNDHVERHNKNAQGLRVIVRGGDAKEGSPVMVPATLRGKLDPKVVRWINYLAHPLCRHEDPRVVEQMQQDPLGCATPQEFVVTDKRIHMAETLHTATAENHKVMEWTTPQFRSELLCGDGHRFNELKSVVDHLASSTRRTADEAYEHNPIVVEAFIDLVNRADFKRRGVCTFRDRT